MGGTSTDVAHYGGEYERQFETEVAGVRMRSPMMAIHTVAAGGGSILHFDGARYRVGPESAGANPGPACYRQNGPLTVTDSNVMLGKIQPEFFPQVFGTGGNLPLDRRIVQQKFTALAQDIQAQTGALKSPEEVAAGFVAIAVENMANAIKKISLQRGYDVSNYVLCCFGGAGGQHACLIADTLGIQQIFLHPFAGVLSAYGMGLADIRVIRERSIERQLTDELLSELQAVLQILIAECLQELSPEIKSINPNQADLEVHSQVHLKYTGTDSSLRVNWAENLIIMQAEFDQKHQTIYGFLRPDQTLMIESIAAEVIQHMETPEEPVLTWSRSEAPIPTAIVPMFTARSWRKTPLFQRTDLQPGDTLFGPAIIIEPTGTNVIELGWQAQISDRNGLILSKGTQTLNPLYSEEFGGNHPVNPGNFSESFTSLKVSRPRESRKDDSDVFAENQTGSKPITHPDPIRLEIFNNLFQFIAEQMGITLQNTATSVNIKERLDFSCAIFDQQGQLVANAPHIPVHLGSMGESVESLIHAQPDLKPGDVYMLNNPYQGGTHLPDITVITPVFNTTNSLKNNLTELPINSPANDQINEQILFYVASRGHQADIGGMTPGSMAANSQTIEQEGILIDHFQLVDQGCFRQSELIQLLSAGAYPARNPELNLADLQAQVAANQKGVQELQKIVDQYGLEIVHAYMGFVQNNAEESVRRAINVLDDGEFTYLMDDGNQIQVAISINKHSRSATIDFTGTSQQLTNNFNAPKAVCKAAVLYVFRTLVNDNIPLNSGCLKPLEIIIPAGSLLNPRYPAAVVAGNVETSQVIVDALYGALGVLAASQGTMNNFTFGNSQYQYYETICGGSGAGPDFDGTDAVQTHMTNSRLTDPEVLEWRFPVLLEAFNIRPGSGGNGQFKGGNGILRRLNFLEPMTASILSGRRRIPPFGLAGGEPGALGRNRVIRQDGTIELLPGTATVEMNPGDRFVIETPGGGGFGKI
ncbi:MAG: 5-oxoprolinase [Oscillatoriales cyanobacterium RM2_1_1]|nr:5-oxoprolinase [Oscillatoriales cyanobacterium RM2_1_1]